MPYVSKYNNARISARKARLVIDLIRGKSFERAITLLTFSKKRAAVMVKKALLSAASNAETQGDAKRDNLVVTEARVDEGMTMKRFQPKDRGRAYQILKRTSHIIVAVDER